MSAAAKSRFGTGRSFRVLFGCIICVSIASFAASAQKSTTIMIHDSTGAAAGGSNATSALRNEIKAALEREKPCVEPMDDQDLRDAIQDERERATLEGGDSDATLQAIGNRVGSNVVVSVKATPGPGGSVLLTASGLDMRTAKMVAREAGGAGSEQQMAESLVRSLGPYLADQCKPHWVGTVRYEFRWNESKEKNDAGAMRAMTRNVKRRSTETSNWTVLIKATLLPPANEKSVNAPQANVMNRFSMIFIKSSSTSGDLYCRLPGRNPFWKGFSEEYSETTTQIGQGTETMPVFIEIDTDGEYSIRVHAPPGILYTKVETRKTTASCENVPPDPDIKAEMMPEGRMNGTSFEANGKASSSKATTLSGSRSLPDGRTKITWSLRMVKPKGK